MKKCKFIISCFAVVLALILFVEQKVSAEDEHDYYYVDSGITIDGTTLVPVREIFKALNVPINWDAKTKTITTKKNGKKIVYKVGSKWVKVNGSNVKLQAAPITLLGVTYVPARSIANQLGATIKFDKAEREVKITLNDVEIDVYLSPVYNLKGIDYSFFPNANYTYEYVPIEGREIHTFLGRKNNVSVWRSVYSYGQKYPPNILKYRETKHGLYLSVDGSNYTRVIQYPIFVGQEWTRNFKSGKQAYAIFATGLTYKAAGKTFKNVIEIYDPTNSAFLYFAPNYGYIGAEAVDFTEKLVRLKKR